LEVEPLPTALPPQENSGLPEDSLSQQSIDGFAKSIPKWSKEGLLEHIVDFVVSDDQVSLLLAIERLKRHFKVCFQLFLVIFSLVILRLDYSWQNIHHV